jgi:GNAT superfamily N-acetyltransferase
VVADGVVVGALCLLFPLKDNPTVAIVDVAVHPGHRRQGIGRALLAEGLALAAAQGRTELIAEVDEPGPGTAGRAFALQHGWTCDLLETRCDLLMPPTSRGAAGRGGDRGARGCGRRSRLPRTAYRS